MIIKDSITKKDDVRTGLKRIDSCTVIEFNLFSILTQLNLLRTWLNHFISKFCNATTNLSDESCENNYLFTDGKKV